MTDQKQPQPSAEVESLAEKLVLNYNSTCARHPVYGLDAKQLMRLIAAAIAAALAASYERGVMSERACSDKAEIETQAKKWNHLDEDSFVIGAHWMRERVLGGAKSQEPA